MIIFDVRFWKYFWNRQGSSQVLWLPSSEYTRFAQREATQVGKDVRVMYVAPKPMSLTQPSFNKVHLHLVVPPQWWPYCIQSNFYEISSLKTVMEMMLQYVRGCHSDPLVPLLLVDLEEFNWGSQDPNAAYLFWVRGPLGSEFVVESPWQDGNMSETAA